MGIPTGREKGPVELARFDRSTLGVFPVQVFAYTCAQNVSFCLWILREQIRLYGSIAFPRIQRIGEEYAAQDEQGDCHLYRVRLFILFFRDKAPLTIGMLCSSSSAIATYEVVSSKHADDPNRSDRVVPPPSSASLATSLSAGESAATLYQCKSARMAGICPSTHCFLSQGIPTPLFSSRSPSSGSYSSWHFPTLCSAIHAERACTI